MVKLYRRGSSKIWWVKAMHNGKLHQISTEKENHKEAIAVATKKVNKIKEGANPKTIMKDLITTIDSLPLDERDSIRKEYATLLLSGTIIKMKLNVAIEKYIEKPRKQSATEKTLKGYKSTFSKFELWMKEQYPEKKYLHDITVEIGEEYLLSEWKSGITARTYNERLKIFRSMFTVLGNSAGLYTNIWKEIPKMQTESISKRMLTREQIESILSIIDGEMKLLFTIGLFTGLRLGDVLFLSWDEINLEERIIRKIPHKTRSTMKVVEIPLHANLERALITIKQFSLSDSETNNFVLPTLAQLHKKDPTAVSKRVQKVFIAAGIKTTEKIKGIKRKAVLYGFHSLRHSFISLCAAENIPAHVVMDIVGHGSEDVHRIYQHTTREQRQQAIDVLPNIDEETKDGENQ